MGGRHVLLAPRPMIRWEGTGRASRNTRALQVGVLVFVVGCLRFVTVCFEA